ncbi:MAG: hypothetical protein M1834_007816 [Cirrosporium novae-zelandiae]|nr:MAG: hypothetical protein M1834_007816 [Cirrosporium novae-zelandiae]
MAGNKILRVGILGCGEIAQVGHLPCLLFLRDYYTTTIVCDISKNAAEHCAKVFHVPRATTNPSDVFNNPNVDIVFILTSDDFHADYCISALKAGKHVMIEKPLTLSLPSAQAILEAAKMAPNGAKVFVGYMRRYAHSFVKAFKDEVASIDKIMYARSRDIIGPNSHFVNQSGTFPIKFVDFPPNAGKERDQRLYKLISEAFKGKEITKERFDYCRFLGSLGSHDLSLMREALGFPEKVVGISAHEPFYTALFTYRNKDGSPFSVTYESGIDEVPRFDAHLAVYGMNKTVTIYYDTPYVKGLPIKVKVDEYDKDGQATTREILTSYEDTYTSELIEMYKCFVEGKPIKTTVEDAMMDLKLYDQMYAQWEAQGQQ